LIFLDDLSGDLILNGIKVSFLHHDFEEIIHKNNQNIMIAIIHLMGDK
jgi:hypothetical protein